MDRDRRELCASLAIRVVRASSCTKMLKSSNQGSCDVAFPQKASLEASDRKLLAQALPPKRPLRPAADSCAASSRLSRRKRLSAGAMSCVNLRGSVE